MTMENFIRLWCATDTPLEKVSNSQIISAERQLGVTFPAVYRTGILNFGLPCPTIALLDKIVDLELDLADVSDFYAPALIVEQTLDWRKLGLPLGLVAFASDCSGNLFCFSLSHDGDAPDDGPISLFNHDFKETAIVSDSFSAWLATYCDLALL